MKAIGNALVVGAIMLLATAQAIAGALRRVLR